MEISCAMAVLDISFAVFCTKLEAVYLFKRFCIFVRKMIINLYRPQGGISKFSLSSPHP